MIGDPVPPTSDMMHRALSECSRLGVKLPYSHLYDILSQALRAEDITVIPHGDDHSCPDGQCSIHRHAKRRQGIG